MNNITMLPIEKVKSAEEDIPNSNVFFDEIELEFTEEAIDRFVEAVKEEQKEFVRIGVKGGGCSGFMYNLDFIDETQIDIEEDIVVDSGAGVKFVMDIFSKEYLKGSTVDYVSSLNENGFKFVNPQMKKGCGCGSSFSV